MHRFRRVALGAVLLLIFGAPPAGAAPSPPPEPVARPTPLVDSAKRVHLGIVSCDGAPFFSWPDRSSSIPSGSFYPPARMGDAINVIGDGTLSTNGMTFYETTIDVVRPYGFGRHYFIDARCINAG